LTRMIGLLGELLIRHAMSTPRLPLQFGEGRGEVNTRYEQHPVFLCETPSHHVRSVALCGKKFPKP
jgi:hypothetical protein